MTKNNKCGKISILKRTEEKEMDKRLSFGRIVGKKVMMKRSKEIGICDYYDKYEKVFYILLKSYENKFNPSGSCVCEREDFEVI